MIRFEDMGYSRVEVLELGEDGVWRGTAEKDGATIAIEFDAPGSVTEGAR